MIVTQTVRHGACAKTVVVPNAIVSPSRWKNGSCQPPRKMVTSSIELVTTSMYSAK
jgi:hypothetical protein